MENQERLPLELIGSIISHCDDKATLLKARLVSKVMKEEAEKNAFWQSEVKELDPKYLKILQKYTPFSAYCAVNHVKDFHFGSCDGADYLKLHHKKHAIRPLNTREMKDLGEPEYEGYEKLHWSIKWSMISEGCDHNVALTQDGQLVEWLLHFGEFSGGNKLPFGTNPFKDMKVVQLSAGERITACLVKDDSSNSDRIFFWDCMWPRETDRVRQYGENVIRTSFLENPIELPRLEETVIKIAAGRRYILALTDLNKVFILKIPITKEQAVSGEIEWTDRIILQAQRSYLKIETQVKMQWTELNFVTDKLTSIGIGPNQSSPLTFVGIEASGGTFSVFAFNDDDEFQGAEKAFVLISQGSNLNRHYYMTDLESIQIVKLRREGSHCNPSWLARSSDGYLFYWEEETEPEQYPPKFVKEGVLTFGYPTVIVDGKQLYETDMFVLDFGQVYGSYHVGALAVDRKMLKLKGYS